MVALTLIADLLAFGMLLFFLALFARDLRRFWLTFRFTQRGRYAEARAIHERIGRSWLAVAPSTRYATTYGIALTLHLEGDFDRALDVLRALPRDRLDKNLTYAVSSLEASTLVLLERDLARAETLLEGIATIHRPPEDLLFLAHAKHGLGDASGAESLLAEVGTTRGASAGKLGRTILVEPKATHEGIFHAVRGLLLVKLGRSDEALKAFELAAAVPLQNWYTERARALLPKATDDENPRSSLAPQVIE
jgi:tetratricopeptide (TPR) repeat protein